jgi:hypothetical protein
MADHDQPLDENEADLDDEDGIEDEDDLEDKDDVEDEDNGGARCPVCRADFYEVGRCPHLVSSLSYSDDEWSWWPDTSEVEDRGKSKGSDKDSPATLAKPSEFVEALSDLVEAWLDTDEDRPLEFLEELIPGRLHHLVTASIEEGRLDGRGAQSYIEGLVAKAPTLAGSSSAPSRRRPGGLSHPMAQADTCGTSPGEGCRRAGAYPPPRPRPGRPRPGSRRNIVKFYHINNIFMMISDEECAGFKADIAAHGRHGPIRTHQGKVIEGRYRYQTSQGLGRRAGGGGGQPPRPGRPGVRHGRRDRLRSVARHPGAGQTTGLGRVDVGPRS